MTDVPSKAMQGKTTVSIIDGEVLRDRIYEIRGQKVMLDFELAEIYGYSTKAFNQQVQRNIEKFEEDFMFQLTDEEWEILRSQIVTSSWGGTRYLPYAFTEQGVYMLMTVLKGELATRQSKALIRLFKHMKDHVVCNQALLDERDRLSLTAQMTSNTLGIIGINKELAKVEEAVAGVVDDMGDFVRRSELASIIENLGEAAVRHGFLFMNGEPAKADEFYEELFRSARHTIFLVDNYINLKTLMLLKDAKSGVKVTVFTDNRGKRLSAQEYLDFKTQYHHVEVEFRDTQGAVHDRYIALDYGTEDEAMYQCGASLKDAGLRCTSVVSLLDADIFHQLFDRLLERPIMKLK